MLADDVRPDDSLKHLDVSAMSCCALPPESEQEYVSKTGLLPTGNEDRRRFARLYYRRKAVVRMLAYLPILPRPETVSCVYLRDISKQGVGFLFDQQLFPGERCLFYVPELGERLLEVASCRRLAPGCYAVGSRFTSPREPASAK